VEASAKMPFPNLPSSTKSNQKMTQSFSQVKVPSFSKFGIESVKDVEHETSATYFPYQFYLPARL